MLKKAQQLQHGATIATKKTIRRKSTRKRTTRKSHANSMGSWDAFYARCVDSLKVTSSRAQNTDKALLMTSILKHFLNQNVDVKRLAKTVFEALKQGTP